MTLGGSYMNHVERVDGEWRIQELITNYDALPPEGFEWGEPPAEAPAEGGTLTAEAEEFETHWNLQHPDMVADLYTPDATVAYANGEPLEGREAVAARLAERMGAMATEIDIHPVATTELADGWRLDGGWYELKAPEGGAVLQSGAYMNLAQRMDDGSWKARWAVSNGRPSGP
jgi:ketosteroid isomerase-like protein